METQKITEVDFNRLPNYQSRSFVPENFNLMSIDQIRELYTSLIERKINDINGLNKFRIDRSELESAIEQAGSILYVRMTCQTDDASRAEEYTKFIEIISPELKKLEDKLNHRYLSLLKNIDEKDDRYLVYNRAIKVDVDLFVDKNVELQTKVELLSQEYQKICGAMTVLFNGEELTMPQMSKFLMDPDRELREKAWKEISNRRLIDKDKLENIFDQMLSLRHQIALNANCKNFRDYKFRVLHRFDYTPEDCKTYHQSIEECVVPVYKKILQKRHQKMKLNVLRPWDMSVDALGRPGLKPFDNVEDLVSGCQKIFHHVDKELGAHFDEMVKLNLLDLASRKGKAPGGYQTSLQESRIPFIFMNAVGVDSDVRTLLHEAGHAFHTLLSAPVELINYRHGPMEFNEVASMAMELLAGNYMEEFYNAEDAKRSLISHLEDIVFVLVWVAIVDCFQHWIYEHPEHTQKERTEAWIRINNRFSTGTVDWSGFEEVRAHLWHRQLHIFEVPFYYIEYGIAQLGALQVWLNSINNWSDAINNYKKGLALGGSAPLPELYQTAGIRLDFSQETIEPLMTAVVKQLSELD